MLTTWKLQKAQQATLKEWKLYCFQRKLYNTWQLTCLVSWPNEAFTYLQAPMEHSGTLEGSLQIKNILEHPTQFYVQPYVQEISRILQKGLDLSHAFHHSVEMCGHLQASLEPSTLFPLMAKCRSLQKLPGLYINPWGGSFEAYCDTQLPQLFLWTFRLMWLYVHC